MAETPRCAYLFDIVYIISCKYRNLNLIMVLITLMIMDNPTTNTKFKVNPYLTEIKPITRALIKDLVKLLFDTAAIP